MCVVYCYGKKMTAPEHMSPWDRNERLYVFLKDLGLFVTPVPHPCDPEKIDYLTVSAAMPQVDSSETERPRPAAGRVLLPFCVRAPIEGSEVGEFVGAFIADETNVIDFPSVS